MRESELQERKKKEPKFVTTAAEKIMVLENPGIDPGTSRMRSGRTSI